MGAADDLWEEYISNHDDEDALCYTMALAVLARGSKNRSELLAEYERLCAEHVTSMRFRNRLGIFMATKLRLFASKPAKK